MGESQMLGDLIRKIGDKALLRTNIIITQAGVKPDWAYLLSILTALFTGLAFWGGYLWGGLSLLILHGICDYFDGGLRRATEKSADKQRPTWIGIDAHVFVDKLSEALIFLGLIGGNWVGWPLGIAALLTSMIVTGIGLGAKKWLDIDPGRVIFERTDRLFAIFVTGLFRVIYIGLVLICLMNGVILFQRLALIILLVRDHKRTT